MSETIAWVDADGVVTTLSGGADTEVRIGRAGAFMPEFALVADVVPLQAGAKLRTVRTRPREVDLPLLVVGTTSAGMRTTVRNLLHLFNPDRGDGRLRVTAPGGDQRELWCRYASGLMGNEQWGVNVNVLKAVLTFWAADPYWYAVDPTIATYLLTEPATFFPFFPLTVNASTIFNAVTLTNAGDVEAWPVWTINGPGSDIYLRNMTTGEYVHVDTTLLNGDVLRIDTRPGYKTVEINGVNLFSVLSALSTLWSLRRGANDVKIEVSGSTSDSACGLNYTLRYLGV